MGPNRRKTHEINKKKVDYAALMDLVLHTPMCIPRRLCWSWWCIIQGRIWSNVLKPWAYACMQVYISLMQSRYLGKYCWAPNRFGLQLENKIAFDECSKLSLTSWCISNTLYFSFNYYIFLTSWGQYTCLEESL